MCIRDRQERAARVRAVVEAKREAFWKDTLTCERLLVALDCNEDAGAASGQHLSLIHIFLSG